MPTQPIPISTTPPPSQSNQNLTTPSSSLSISPQTPFLPPPSLNTPTPTTTSSGFFKWATSLAKSPGAMSPPISSEKQRGFDVSPGTPDQDNDHEAHDSFEFGDFSDLKSRSWTGGRRAASMSMPSGQPASGVTSMLKGFGETPQPPPVSGGVMADKMARGQSVLRRLSFTGPTYRPNLLSPPMQSAPFGSSPSATSAQTVTTTASVPNPTPAAVSIAPEVTAGPPQADVPVQRAVTIGSGRRRYSETGSRRRGVSPMGERILREHGHF